MKKLLLYGEKGDLKGTLATIYLKDGKVVVESEDKVIKETLEVGLNKRIEEFGGGLYSFTTSRPPIFDTGDPDDETVIHAHLFPVAPFIEKSDDEFLEAIVCHCLTQWVGCDKSGNAIYGFCVKLRKMGYKFPSWESRIVEE